jgi:hypothetical protein
MLSRVCPVLFLLWPSLALGQVYLVEPTNADCLARSAAQCTALGCDGVHTKYWWGCEDLNPPTISGGVSGSGGSAALVIYPDTPYGTNGLSQAEIAAVQTKDQLAAAQRRRKSVKP